MFRQSPPFWYLPPRFIPSKVSSGNLSAAIDAGAITIAGQSFDTLLETTADPGAITFAGQSILAALGEPISAGAITFAGQSFSDNINVAITSGSITFAGQSVTTALGAALGGGAITFAGQTVAADLNGSIAVGIDAGAITFNGQLFTASITNIGNSSGGWYAVMELHSMQRRGKRKELEDAQEAEKTIEQEIDRNIAKLLHEQEAKDEERKDLSRIRALVLKYKDTAPVDIDSERVQKALMEAQKKATTANLERLQREFERMLEEEEHAVLMLLASLD